MIQVNPFAKMTTMIPTQGLATFGKRAARGQQCDRRDGTVVVFRLVYLLFEKYMSWNRDFISWFMLSFDKLGH